MWLDAFIPKNRNMLNIGVPGVPGVPPPSKPNEYMGLAGTPSRNTEKNQGVPGVPLQQTGTPGTPGNTAVKTRCSSVPPPSKPNEYMGLAICGTPGTPGTPQKHLSAENKSDAADLIRDFMEMDGMALAEAQAMAAVSVRPRPASEWIALIADLDAAIGRYCTVTGLTDEARAAILDIRYKQSLASIPSALAWFNHELAHMARRPAAPEQRREQTKADLNLERGRLHQQSKENHRRPKN